MQRELLRYPASPVRIQTGIKNKVHAVLAKNKITHAFSDLFRKQGKDFLSSLSISEMHRLALNGYLLIPDELEQQIRAVNKRIRDSVRDDEKKKLLMTIPGVEYYSALSIRSEIGDINRFPSAKKPCSYAGVIPSAYASRNTVSHGHITRQGSKWLRWIMAEVVTHCIDKPGRLQRFYSKL
jgi:transposase